MKAEKQWKLSDPQWFKDAVIYEVRLRSFFDANGDGIGDIKGLTQKLGYIQDLGVDTIWLLPFYPSPLIDDGYDIADYTGIAPELGHLRDFRKLLSEAHDRGLRVVTELVLNHTSDQHPWFQRARRALAGSKHRDFYVWSDDPSRYSEARIIFQDFETSNWTWDPVAEQYFWHRFYSNQPDLNFESPDVQAAVLSVVDFWLNLGVDGLRLDAVPYLFERDGTNCENLPETHDFLRRLRSHIDKKFPNRMLLAEANQWPEDAVSYFGDGDECHMCFHFPIMPRLFMALRMEDSFPILDILEQTPEIPDGCQWAIFLRNHDELTLEMVTDEERDYMVSAYAVDRSARVNLGIRRRLAPLLENHRGRIELMNALLFSLPGTPVLYYGDEIGMGDNVYLGDRNGVRTPMQWSGDRNAGFSYANPQKLVLPPIQDPEYHFSSVNVEAQQQNPSSLLWWTKRIVDLRKQFTAFGRGSFEPLFPKNRRVLAFLRRYEGQVILVVANLSRFAQYVELDLGEFEGHSPRELFGNGEFPEIGELPYMITLGPHGFYWFAISDSHEAEEQHRTLPILRTQGAWEGVLSTTKNAPIARALGAFMPEQRWYRDKTRAIKSVTVEDAIPLAKAVRLVVALVEFSSGEPSHYCIPVAFEVREDEPETAIAQLRAKGTSGYLTDAAKYSEVASALLKAITKGGRLRGRSMEIVGHPASGFGKGAAKDTLEGKLLGAEQTNTSYLYGKQFVLKLLRKVEPGQSQELEVLSHLSTNTFSHYPNLLGHLDINGETGSTGTLGILQEFVENQGDAWRLAVDAVAQFYEEAATLGPAPPLPKEPLLELRDVSPPPELEAMLGAFVPSMELLGQRTAELHVALSAADDPEFRRDTFGALSKRAFYQSIRNLAARAFDGIKAAQKSLPEEDRLLAQAALRAEKSIRARMSLIRERPLAGARIRVHGDFHLGQVLHTGKDFIILDYEGEPARSPSHRRGKRSPIADVAGMLRSFHYAAHAGMKDDHIGVVREADHEVLSGWAEVWQVWVGARFLRGYFRTIARAELLPTDSEELRLLLDAYLMEKALYEVAYELENRPSWVGIPLRALIGLGEANSPSK